MRTIVIAAVIEVEAEGLRPSMSIGARPEGLLTEMAITYTGAHIVRVVANRCLVQCANGSVRHTGCAGPCQ